MKRMSYNEAVEILEALAKTAKVKTLDRRTGTDDPRYALEMSGEYKMKFMTGFEVVQAAKYVQANHITSVAKLVEADVTEWWAKTSKENTKEFFEKRNRELKERHQLEHYVNVITGEDLGYHTENEMESMFS